MFLLYFIIFVIAFYLRPGTDTRPTIRPENRTDPNGTMYVQNITVKDPCYLLRVDTDYDKVYFILVSLVTSAIH